ncbi:MAG TPA: hypothetical protein VE223_07605 [Nitrososphaeraceae archaeon]|nr:hypothetical protein [Nitrososphaeraceae archaeon]
MTVDEKKIKHLPRSTAFKSGFDRHQNKHGYPSRAMLFFPARELP